MFDATKLLNALMTASQNPAATAQRQGGTGGGGLGDILGSVV